jgi:PTS system nitrogen regulatory IIA component
MHFGAALRLLRLEAGVPLAELARQLGVSSAYISRVERGHDPPPTTDRLLAISRALGLPAALLMEIAQQFGPAVTSYMERVPVAGPLFLEIARRDLGPADLGRLRAFMDREFPVDRPSRRASVRLRGLLKPSCVVPGLVCAGLDDIVEVAVSRMELRDPRGASARILAREKEASSALGSQLAVPHGALRGERPQAVLVTLASPLATTTPDGEPLTVAVVVVSDDKARHLELLAHVARLAVRGLADELRGLRSPVHILERLEQLEAW